MDSLPIVSVIIATFNYGYYLPKAIQSVLSQTYHNIEIIVIDDGSTDETSSIVRTYPTIRYHFQQNTGVSAARNLGIKEAKGKYIVFLDADDWLEPDAIENNLKSITQNSHLAFVSGNYYLLRETEVLEETKVFVTDNHYVEMLKRNYIGMIGAVIFASWILKKMKFDESLTSCEDYDLYLRIAKYHPVSHHQKFIAYYNFHHDGLSHKYNNMMETIIKVMNKQSLLIETEEELKAYQIGMEQWKHYSIMISDSTR